MNLAPKWFFSGFLREKVIDLVDAERQFSKGAWLWLCPESTFM